MKSASSSLKASLAWPNRVFTPVDLYEIALPDGTELYFTAFDYDVKFTGSGPRAGRIYRRAHIKRANIVQKRGAQVSTFKFFLINDPANTIELALNPAQSVLSGRWFGGTVTLLRGVTASLAHGMVAEVGEAVTMAFGPVGEVTQDRSLVTVSVDSPMKYLNLNVPWRVLGPDCRWTLFDPNCTLVQSDFGVGNVAKPGTTSDMLLADMLGVATGEFDMGQLVWTSGPNAGLTSTVRAFVGQGPANRYENIVIADQPLAYYRLNGDCRDSSGHGYDGANQGSLLFSGSGGPLAEGSGYGIFTGASNCWMDISTVPDPHLFAPNGFFGALSFEFFFNVSEAKQPNGAFGTGALNDGVGLWNFSSDEVVDPGFKWGSNHPFGAFQAILNQWVHCVAVFRGQRYIDIILNGYLYATVDDFGDDRIDWVSPSIGRAVLPLQGYAPVGGNTKYLIGNMSEMAIYPYAMDVGQAYVHYAASQVNSAELEFSQLYLLKEPPNRPQAGDSFIVYPGCSKAQRRCGLRFNNIDHYGGAPFMPPVNQSG